MKQSMPKRLTQIQILLRFDDGWKSLVRSPQKAVKLGLRTRFGWLLILCGAWIIFGNAKQFRTILNPLFDEPQEDK